MVKKIYENNKCVITTVKDVSEVLNVATLTTVISTLPVNVLLATSNICKSRPHCNGYCQQITKVCTN